MPRRGYYGNHGDLSTFLGTVVDTSELTRDLTTSPRKKIFFGAYCAMALALVIAIMRFGEQLEKYRRSRITLWLFLFLFAVEPCFLVTQAIILRISPSHFGPAITDNKRIGVIITCHKSEEEIVNTVRACLNHFGLSQVFVIDNANNPDDGLQTQAALERAELHPVHYIFQPIGNKTLALYAGAIAAKDFDLLVSPYNLSFPWTLHHSLTHSPTQLLIDDDTRLPPNMVFDQSFFGPDTVKAVCYPIRAVGPKDPDTDETDDSYIVKWQELEYKMCDYGKQFQTRFSTVLYPHGAISLWEREALIQCLREHDTVFFGDDVKMGLWLTENNYEMRLDDRYQIDTEAPISFPTLYEQRGESFVRPLPELVSTPTSLLTKHDNHKVRSWDMGEHMLTLEHFRMFLTTKHHTVLGTIVLKIFQGYACFCVLVDWIRVPALILTFCLSPTWRRPLFVLVGLMAATIVAVLIWDFLGYSEERRSPVGVILSFPLFKVPVVCLRWLGWGVAFFVYFPNFTPRPTIPELEELYAGGRSTSVQPQCPIWLRSWDFDYGSYFRHYDSSQPLEISRSPSLGRSEVSPLLQSYPSFHSYQSPKVESLISGQWKADDMESAVSI